MSITPRAVAGVCASENCLATFVRGRVLQRRSTVAVSTVCIPSRVAPETESWWTTAASWDPRPCRRSPRPCCWQVRPRSEERRRERMGVHGFRALCVSPLFGSRPLAAACPHRTASQESKVWFSASLNPMPFPALSKAELRGFLSGPRQGHRTRGTSCPACEAHAAPQHGHCTRGTSQSIVLAAK